MSVVFATQLTAMATAILAAFTIITAVVAAFAFKKQSNAVSDGREMIGQQKDMLEVQAKRLDVYRQQVDEQRQINDEQRKLNVARVETLELQAREIRASLDQWERDAEEQRRSQAARVTAWFARPSPEGPWGAVIRNASDLPILDVRTFFNYIAEKWPGGDWDPVMRGGPVEKIRVLPPAQDRFVEIPEQVRDMLDQVSDSVYSVSIEFTDAAGNHWEREPRGALVPRT
jgi:hypothetical protein